MKIRPLHGRILVTRVEAQKVGREPAHITQAVACGAAPDATRPQGESP